MNYCRRCESDYEKPGTCNCFAEKQADNVPAPIYQNPPFWVQPLYVPPTPYPDWTYYPYPFRQHETTCGDPTVSIPFVQTPPYTDAYEVTTTVTDGEIVYYDNAGNELQVSHTDH